MKDRGARQLARLKILHCVAVSRFPMSEVWQPQRRPACHLSNMMSSNGCQLMHDSIASVLKTLSHVSHHVFFDICVRPGVDLVRRFVTSEYYEATASTSYRVHHRRFISRYLLWLCPCGFRCDIPFEALSLRMLWLAYRPITPDTLLKLVSRSGEQLITKTRLTRLAFSYMSRKDVARRLTDISRSDSYEHLSLEVDAFASVRSTLLFHRHQIGGMEGQ